MYVGDYLLTAVAIGKNVGLLPLGSDAGVLARDVGDLKNNHQKYLSKNQIDEMTEATVVWARATPEDKLVIVKSLQRKGHIVAMTGDGGKIDR